MILINLEQREIETNIPITECFNNKICMNCTHLEDEHENNQCYGLLENDIIKACNCKKFEPMNLIITYDYKS
jgi:hypothetical protein